MNLIRKIFPKSLGEAARFGRIKPLKRFLNAQPSQDEKNKAFLSAVFSRQLNAAQVLFENGADINTRDSRGDSALHYACEWPSPQYSAVQWLIENGADVNASNNDGMTPETGHTPLFDAASSYNYSLARFLLEAGANPNALSPDGSPLHRVCSSGFKYTEEIFEKYGGNIVRLLLEHGGNPNLPNEFNGKTPLHVATDFSDSTGLLEKRHFSIVSLLMSCNADPQIPDKSGKTPLDYALKNGHVNIVDLLRDPAAFSISKSTPHKSMLEKAEDVPISMRILIDLVREKLEREYPQVFLLPKWSHFTLAGAIAGCAGLAARLHFDVPQDMRTDVELAMRDELQKLYFDSEHVYEDCSRFLMEGLKDIPRTERGNYFFVLLGYWIIGVVSEGCEIDQQKYIVAIIAEALQNETAGFWKSPSPYCET